MRRLPVLLCALFLLATATATPAAADPPPEPVPGERPPLGITWATGDPYCLYNSGEDVVKAAADQLVGSGLRDAGYEYVMLGDCWQAAQRDADGKLTARTTFSASIPALVDYVHARGLKIGFSSGTGAKTCSGQAAGSLDHEDLDAQTFAGWGADYLRYDTCYSVNGDAPARVKKMADALKRTGRPITLEVDDYDRNQSPWLWARGAGAQVWRTYKNATFDFGYSAGSLDKQYGLEGYAGPGGWNMPGSFTFSYLDTAERQAKLGLWAVLNAPLVADMALTADTTLPADVMANPDIIAVDQDWAGVAGHKVRDTGWTEVWTKPMSDGSAVLVLFNRGELAAPITTSVADAGLPAASGYRVRDLWTGEETESTGALGGTVGRHAATVLRVWPANTTAAPRTSLTVELPDSVPPDRPVTATVRFANAGSTPVTGAHLQLTAPAQWQFDSPAEADAATVAPGATWETAVTLHPVSTATEPFRMPATVTYTTAQGTRTTSARAEAPLLLAPNPPYTNGLLNTQPWMSSENGLGPVERDSTDNGHPLTVNGKTDAHGGLGAHAPSVVRYYLGGKCRQFTATVGVDDRGPGGTLGFRVLGDGVELEATGDMRHGDPAQHLAVPVTGVQVLALAVDDASDGSAGDWGDWLSPYLTC
ncbi:NPCBM/NEW2 domain-containing protein [Amycolatopsis sp. Hca4]|uniref:NPCBM/NEW2 domain-containing protein n=1 Tax=Amycolatopsis sp. Hca4 TaxID=2742131 RepID=UPI00159023E6|nr:NPCBM/NEW2 domain-containing protein [Amycolatopsis sp. Hca4]QKV80217.1 NPCBM/NEW2 domain-containing protein [Amycolatopsis sp. Hca4]